MGLFLGTVSVAALFVGTDAVSGYVADAAVSAGGSLAAYAANGVIPEFVVDFVHAGGPRYLGTLSSYEDLGFSRLSAGRYQDASGVLRTAGVDEPRFTHHLHNGEWYPGGLLLEPGSSNVFTAPNDFTNGQWVKASSAITYDQIGPDGVVNSAATMAGNGGGSGPIGLDEQLITLEDFSEYTWSMTAKAGSVNGLLLYIGGLSAPFNVGIYFDLENGVVSNTYNGGAGLLGRILDLGNGWYRCSLTFTTDDNDTTGSFQPYLANVTGTPSIALPRDASSWIQIHETDLVKSGIMSSPIGNITRAADELTVMAGDLPGNFFMLRGYLDFPDSDQTEQQVLFHRETDASNLMKLTLDTSGSNTGKITLTVVTGGISTTLSTTSELVPGFKNLIQVAFGATGTELALAMNGIAETRVNSGLPDLSLADAQIQLIGTLTHLTHWSENIDDIGLEEASSAGFFNLGTGLYDARLNHVFVYGQSLSLGSTPALSTSPAYDHQMFFRGLRPQYDYDQETPAQWYASLVPMVEETGETPTRGALDTVKE